MISPKPRCPDSSTPPNPVAVSLLPIDGADTGHSVIVTDTLRQEPVSDLPGKHGGVLPLVVSNLLHHLGGGHLGLGAPYHSRPDAASLVVPTPIENPKELPNKQVVSPGWDLARDSCSSPRLLGVRCTPRAGLRYLMFLALSVSLA